MSPLRKATLNFLLEGVTLLDLMLLVATGMTMEFRLPPGIRGGGEGIAQLGLGRHDWGEIHFYLALGFLALIALHLWLHWRWLWGLVRGRAAGAVRAARVWTFCGASLLFLALAAAPWLVPVTGTPRSGAGVAAGGAGFFVRGSSTFGEVAASTGMEPAQLAQRLGLKRTPAAGKRLGPALREAGLTMSEARERLALPHEDHAD